MNTVCKIVNVHISIFEHILNRFDQLNTKLSYEPALFHANAKIFFF